ncbi:MAG: sigma-54 dependent transcriptional regulator [Polyangiaceae bacterium]|nr:sigma-54 dependent transcriptional regulator [Polyangiaceae bacterium]
MANDAPREDAEEPPQPLRAGEKGTVLIVDDERNNLVSLGRIFRKESLRVLEAENAHQALEQLRAHQVHVVLTDLMMPGPSGVELLKAVKELSPQTEVVLMTAFGTVETAVGAMREGAYDFVEKPLKRADIVRSVQKALQHSRLVAENQQLKEEIRVLTSREIVGQSRRLRAVLELTAQAAPSMATVLILGESGTGKELIARSLHSQSTRSEKEFIAVNCSAIPESILEAELFGYEKGAFTGATGRRAGRFERAQGGTLFLDEVGELSPAVQVKLLRVIQEGEFEPLGGQARSADVRIVAATNRDLRALVEAGEFREDLFYRLNVISITAPALRDRREDIPLLADHFLGIYCQKNARGRLSISKDVLRALSDWTWPGNVRELENVMERASVLCRGTELTLTDLPNEVVEAEAQEQERVVFEIGTPLEEVEQKMIRATLMHAQGDKSLAAQLLGISARTIYRRLGEES